LQKENMQSIHVGHTFVDGAKDATFHSYDFNLGSKYSRHTLQCHLNSTGMSGNLRGLALLSQDQQCDTLTSLQHSSPHSSSTQNYKAILTDHSRALFCGKVLVQRGAMPITSTQFNKNLLLSFNARVDSKPQLEIYADDVKCSHGSTVGHIHPEELFYLQSRGVSEERARFLLSFAFGHSLLLDLMSESIRQDFASELSEFLINAIATGGGVKNERSK
jgi:Fe-S cluster assembly protein SufD